MKFQDVFSLVLQRQNQNFNPNDNIVLLTFDDNYLNQSINLIRSIDVQHTQGMSYLCVCPPLKPEHIDLLMSLSSGIQLRCYEFTDDFRSGNWSTCAVLRLFCPWLLEDNFHRVVYMDSDILCSGSIQALFTIDVPCIAMAPEISGNVTRDRKETFRQPHPTNMYCNSGVVVFNLDYLRKTHNFQEFYSKLLEMRGKYLYLDQDFLNHFFIGRIEYLNPYCYNFQAYELLGNGMYFKAQRDCRLIHYSVGKPWHYKTRLPLIRLYLKYSHYEPMITRVKKVQVQAIAYLPIMICRQILSPIKQSISLKKYQKEQKNS